MRMLWVLVMTGYLVLAVSPTLLAAAPDAQPNDRVSFQVEAGTEVENDQVHAVLSVSSEDKAPADLADSINRTMQWALEQSRGTSGVKTRSGSYQTYPVYDEKKIVNWRGRQELHLESQDVAQITRLIGILQSRLQMQSLQFSVSPERRTEVEAVLIDQALVAFQKRAALISKSLGAQNHRLLDVSITTGRHDSPIPMRAEMVMASRAQVSEPALEGGTSRINVQAGGSIQLLRD